jgi:hypothetical protein
VLPRLADPSSVFVVLLFVNGSGLRLEPPRGPSDAFLANTRVLVQTLERNHPLLGSCALKHHRSLDFTTEAAVVSEDEVDRLLMQALGLRLVPLLDGLLVGRRILGCRHAVNGWLVRCPRCRRDVPLKPRQEILEKAARFRRSPKTNLESCLTLRQHVTCLEGERGPWPSVPPWKDGRSRSPFPRCCACRSPRERPDHPRRTRCDAG